MNEGGCRPLILLKCIFFIHMALLTGFESQNSIYTAVSETSIIRWCRKYLRQQCEVSKICFKVKYEAKSSCPNILLKIEDFSSVKLVTQCLMYQQKCFRHTIRANNLFVN